MNQAKQPRHAPGVCYPQLQEGPLVRLAQAGDGAAFGELARRCRPRLAGMLARLLVNRADADDAVQSVLLCAWQALPGFRGEARFYSWLHAIARNFALCHLRLLRLRPDREGDTPHDTEEADAGALAQPEQVLACRRLQATVFASVRALPPPLRAAYVLREYSGLPYGELSRVLGCPVGTVRSRLARARASVIEQVQRDLL